MTYSKEFEAFRMHKKTARGRGIPFHFGFAGWVKWWHRKLGPDWMSKRGRHKGLYVMARRLDQGPYAPWNVECQLFEINCRHRKQNGTAARGAKIGIAKLNDASAKAIFLAEGSFTEIGRKFGVSIHIVRRIKNRQCWYHVTAGLERPPIYTYKLLTKNEVAAIYLDKRSIAVLARIYGRDPGTIRGIKRHRAWCNVTASLRTV